MTKTARAKRVYVQEETVTTKRASHNSKALHDAVSDLLVYPFVLTIAAAIVTLFAAMFACWWLAIIALLFGLLCCWSFRTYLTVWGDNDPGTTTTTRQYVELPEAKRARK